MKFVLGPNEFVDVTFEGTDGEVTVIFDEHGIKVTADLADDTGRQGTIYEETWKHDLDPNEGPVEEKPVQNRGMDNLTQQDRIHIRTAFASGDVTKTQLVQKYGISFESLRHILESD